MTFLEVVLAKLRVSCSVRIIDTFECKPSIMFRKGGLAPKG